MYRRVESHCLREWVIGVVVDNVVELLENCALVCCHKICAFVLVLLHVSIIGIGFFMQDQTHCHHNRKGLHMDQMSLGRVEVVVVVAEPVDILMMNLCCCYCSCSYCCCFGCCYCPNHYCYVG